MKNEISHSSHLLQETHNIIKPEFFSPDLINKNPSQEGIPTNNQTYPYINLHISFDNQNKNNNFCTYFCTISIKYNGLWKEFDRTEIKCVNHYEKFIKFTKYFTLAYVFQVKQQIKFTLYQQNYDLNYNNENQVSNQSNENHTDQNELETYKILGECEILLSSVALVSSSKEIQIPLKKNDQNPSDTVTFLRIKPEQVDHSSSIVNGQIICEKLKKSRWMSCNEPFFVISKKKTVFNPLISDIQDDSSDQISNSQIQKENNPTPPNNDFLPVYQSEVNKKMQFKPFSIPYQILCNMDKDVPIRITFYCQRKHKKPKIIGYNDTTFSRLFLSIDQILPVFHIDNSASIVGSFKIVNLSIHHKSNLYDYLQSGIKLNYITVIDFTSLIKDESEFFTSHDDANCTKTIDNTNFSISPSSSSSPLPSLSATQNDSLQSDTENIDANFRMIPTAPTTTKRKTRNSFMETNTRHTQSYCSSSSSSSPNPFQSSIEEVKSAFSLSSIENLRRSNNSQNVTERCIKSIGEIIGCYSNGNSYPALGFGAEIDGKLKNCFPLSLNVNNPCVNGIDGVVRAFNDALRSCRFKSCGPTLFSPVIRYASRYAIQSFEKNRSYSVLVVLTAGIINDMQDTIDALVDASRLPLSIILVGINVKKSKNDACNPIGNRLRSEMEVLNSFNDKSCNAQNSQLISRTGRKMERNVVKFVLFDELKSDEWNTSEILKDVPYQLVEWTEMNGIKSYNA